MVLVDPATEFSNELMGDTLKGQQQTTVGIFQMFGLAARLGIVRFLDPREMAPYAPFILGSYSSTGSKSAASATVLYLPSQTPDLLHQGRGVAPTGLGLWIDIERRVLFNRLGEQSCGRFDLALPGQLHAPTHQQ